MAHRDRCDHGLNPKWCALCLREKGGKSEIAYNAPPEDDEASIYEYPEEDPGYDGDKFLDPAEAAFAARPTTHQVAVEEGEEESETARKTAVADAARDATPPSLLTSVERICSVCGRHRIVHKDRKSGKDICQNCRQKARYPDRPTHNESDKAICHKRRKIGKCAECKEARALPAFGLCSACYQRQRRANMAARPA